MCIRDRCDIIYALEIADFFHNCLKLSRACNFDRDVDNCDVAFDRPCVKGSDRRLRDVYKRQIYFCMISKRLMKLSILNAQGSPIK